MSFMLCLVATLAEPVYAQTATENWEDAFLEFTDKSPGVAVALIKGDKVVFKKTAGMASLEHGIAIGRKTIFPLASVSKQFTAYAIATLAHQGKVNLQDDIRNYLPEVPDYGKKISVADLLFHTSGLRDDFELFLLAGYDNLDYQSQARTLSLIESQQNLSFDPGSAHEYNNAGYTLLGEIISRISGVTFAEWMKVNVFKPLQMDDTFVRTNAQSVIRNMASAYESGANENIYNHTPLIQDNVGPAGIYTHIDDLGKWLIHLNNGHSSDDPIVQRMLQTGSLSNGEHIGYGYGLVNSSFLGFDAFSHSGNSGSFLSYMSWIPKEQLGVVVLSNYYPVGNPVLLGNEILQRYLQVNAPVSAPGFDPQIEKEKLEKDIIALSPEKLKAFEGAYWQPGGNYVREIELRNDTLHYVRNNNSSSKLAPIGDSQFLMLGTQSLLLVRFEEDSVMQVIVNDEPPTSYYKRERVRALTTEMLEEYSGHYYSEELLKVYQLYPKEESMYVKTISHPEKRLNPTIKDYFNPGFPWWLGYELSFKRNAQQKIVGFFVQQFHARNIWFKKID